MRTIIFILLCCVYQNTNAQNGIKFADSISKKYSYIYPSNLSGYYFARTSKNKTALLDSLGNVIIKTIYDYIDNFTSGIAEATNTKNKVTKRGLIDFSGEIVVPFMYDYIYRYSNENTIVTIGEKYGVITNTNKILVPIKYEYITDANENILIVKENNKYGFVTETGKPITKCIYKDVERFYEKIATVLLEDNSGSIINTEGKQLFSPIKNIQFTNVRNGLLRAYNGVTKKIGIYNTKGEIKIPTKYDDIDIYEKCIRVKYKNKYGILDTENSIKIPIEYEYLYNAAKNHFICEKDKKACVLNVENEIVIPNIYKRISFIDEKKYFVRTSDSLCGVVSIDGKSIIPVEYKFYNYCEDKIFVEKNNNFLILNTENINDLIKLDIDGIKEIDNGWSFTKNCIQIALKNGKYGVIDTENKTLIPFEYEFIRKLYYNRGYIVQQNGKYGIVDSTNKIIHAIIYDGIIQEKESIRFMKDGKRVLNPS